VASTGPSRPGVARRWRPPRCNGRGGGRRGLGRPRSMTANPSRARTAGAGPGAVISRPISSGDESDGSDGIAIVRRSARYDRFRDVAITPAAARIAPVVGNCASSAVRCWALHSPPELFSRCLRRRRRDRVAGPERTAGLPPDAIGVSSGASRTAADAPPGAPPPATTSATSSTPAEPPTAPVASKWIERHYP